MNTIQDPFKTMIQTKEFGNNFQLLFHFYKGQFYGKFYEKLEKKFALKSGTPKNKVLKHIFMDFGIEYMPIHP